MNMLKINLGILITALLSIALSACGGGSVSGYNVPKISTTVTLATITPLVLKGGVADITWSSADSSSCSSLPEGVTGTSGLLTTAPLLTNTTYTVTCVGPTGSASKSLTLHIASAEIITASTACANEPMRGGTPANQNPTVYYYCDCGTGSEADCKPGDDSAADNSAATPQRTIAHAAARFKDLAVNDTVALCKGGAFNSAGNLRIGSKRCVPGVACNDLREYTPPPSIFVGTEKPIINNAAGSSILFNFWDNGGVRLLNLKLQGNGGIKGIANQGFFFYRGANDLTMCNLTMDNFDIAVYNESNDEVFAPNTNIKFTGNLVTNSSVIGYLGGGDNDELSYNYWDGNGSSTVFGHTLYFASSRELKNMRVVGNYVGGQYGPTCYGAPVVGHVAVDGLLVKDNIVDIAASATTGGCWGMAFTNFTSATFPVYHRNAIFSGNTIRNGGNLALTVTGCPGCVIENNLIIFETAQGGTGIGVAAGKVRVGIAEDLNTRNVIRNNTIWYGPYANTGGVGIKVGEEGGGYIISNNTVTYGASAEGNRGRLSCFSYPLALTNYAFINNNHCESAAPFNWEETRGDLTSWMDSGFDATSITGNPLFTTPGTNFKPASNSPLIRAGNGDIRYVSPKDFTGATRPILPAIGAYEPSL